MASAELFRGRWDLSPVNRSGGQMLYRLAKEDLRMERAPGDAAGHDLVCSAGEVDGVESSQRDPKHADVSAGQSRTDGFHRPRAGDLLGVEPGPAGCLSLGGPAGAAGWGFAYGCPRGLGAGGGRRLPWGGSPWRGGRWIRFAPSWKWLDGASGLGVGRDDLLILFRIQWIVLLLAWVLIA